MQVREELHKAHGTYRFVELIGCRRLMEEADPVHFERQALLRNEHFDMMSRCALHCAWLDREQATWRQPSHAGTIVRDAKLLNRMHLIHDDLSELWVGLRYGPFPSRLRRMGRRALFLLHWLFHELGQHSLSRRPPGGAAIAAATDAPPRRD